MSRTMAVYVRYNKEIKNAPGCIVELYKHAGIFKNTREAHREHEASPSASRTSRVCGLRHMRALSSYNAHCLSIL